MVLVPTLLTKHRSRTTLHSSTVSTGSHSGVYQLVLARVFVGESKNFGRAVHEHTQALTAPPAGFDSVMAALPALGTNSAHPSGNQFVVYRENRSYPAYVVTYTLGTADLERINLQTVSTAFSVSHGYEVAANAPLPHLSHAPGVRLPRAAFEEDHPLLSSLVEDRSKKLAYAAALGLSDGFRSLQSNTASYRTLNVQRYGKPPGSIPNVDSANPPSIQPGSSCSVRTPTYLRPQTHPGLPLVPLQPAREELSILLEWLSSARRALEEEHSRSVNLQRQHVLDKENMERSFRVTLQQLQGDLRVTQSRLRESEEQLHESEGERHAAQERLRESEGRLDVCERERQAAQERLREREQQLHECKGERDESQERLQQCEVQLDAMQRQRDASEGRLQRRLEEVQQELEGTRQELQVVQRLQLVVHADPPQPQPQSSPRRDLRRGFTLRWTMGLMVGLLLGTGLGVATQSALGAYMDVAPWQVVFFVLCMVLYVALPRLVRFRGRAAPRLTFAGAGDNDPASNALPGSGSVSQVLDRVHTVTTTLVDRVCCWRSRDTLPGPWPRHRRRSVACQRALDGRACGRFVSVACVAAAFWALQLYVFFSWQGA